MVLQVENVWPVLPENMNRMEENPIYRVVSRVKKDIIAQREVQREYIVLGDIIPEKSKEKRQRGRTDVLNVMKG